MPNVLCLGHDREGTHYPRSRRAFTIGQGAREGQPRHDHWPPSGCLRSLDYEPGTSQLRGSGRHVDGEAASDQVRDHAARSVADDAIQAQSDIAGLRDWGAVRVGAGCMSDPHGRVAGAGGLSRLPALAGEELCACRVMLVSSSVWWLRGVWLNRILALAWRRVHLAGPHVVRP